MDGGPRRLVVQFCALLAHVADPWQVRLRHLWPSLCRALGRTHGFPIVIIRLIILLTLLFASPVWASCSAEMAPTTVPPSGPPLGLLLARYEAGIETSSHILQKCRQPQVIAHYLSAEAQAAGVLSTSIVVSAANYRFRCIGRIGTGATLTYVFQITPRQKRVGLFQGELWIDASSGIAVRTSGHMVKMPSALLRSVDVVQDTDIRDGRPYRRITRFDIDTRSEGHAELITGECTGELPLQRGDRDFRADRPSANVGGRP